MLWGLFHKRRLVSRRNKDIANQLPAELQLLKDEIAEENNNRVAEVGLFGLYCHYVSKVLCVAFE